MNRTLAGLVTTVTVAMAATACGGSSSGPGGLLDPAVQASVVAACANVQTANTDLAAGDDASAVTALQAAVTVMRKPPVDKTAPPVADSMSAKLAAGDTAGALAAGTAYCKTRGQ